LVCWGLLGVAERHNGEWVWSSRGQLKARLVHVEGWGWGLLEGISGGGKVDESEIALGFHGDGVYGGDTSDMCLG